jgi:hypothetical protein
MRTVYIQESPVCSSCLAYTLIALLVGVRSTLVQIPLHELWRRSYLIFLPFVGAGCPHVLPLNVVLFELL